MTTPSKYIACIIPRIPFFALRTSHSTAFYFILSSKPLPSKLRFIGLSQHPNNVGYVSTPSESKVYMAYGASFVGVGDSDGLININDIVPSEGYSMYGDLLYVVNPDTCEADYQLMYVTKADMFDDTWVDGWYDEFYSPFTEEIAVGTGFQTAFSGSDFTLTSAGQVFNDGYTIDMNGKVYQFIVNSTGRTIEMNEILPGGEYSMYGDLLYVVNPESCEADYQLMYVTKEDMMDDTWVDGWYDEFYSPYEEPVLPGQGFQTAFSGGDVQLSFPPAIPEK